VRIWGYIRVSTEEQANEGVGLPAQRRSIEAYRDLQTVQGRAFDLAELVADEGISAKTLRKRPGVMRVLEAIDGGRCDGVIVAKLDRLTRSLEDWTWLIRNYFRGDRPKARLFSVAEEVNTTTATGRMVLNMIMTIAEWERETISERTASGMRELIARGQTTGKPPYGKGLAPDGKTLVDHPRELAAIREMKWLAAHGASLRKIAGRLRELGILTREGKRDWAPNTIAKILRREADLGEDVEALQDAG